MILEILEQVQGRLLLVGGVCAHWGGAADGGLGLRGAVVKLRATGVSMDCTHNMWVLGTNVDKPQESTAYGMQQG